MPRPNEFQLIDGLRSAADPHPRVVMGIGDDSAVLAPTGDAPSLVTVDMLMEGVHFTMPPLSASAVGRKALAVNLSDIAAMAGRPLAAFVSVALPRNGEPDLPERLMEGVTSLAAEFDVALAGGDTNVWDGPLVISITLWGEPTGCGPVLRRGAQVGDRILVTGTLGGSLSSGRHAGFQPRVDEAQRLHQTASLHAMIDLSDGLAVDLHRVLDESGVGARIDAESVPVSEAAQAASDGKTPLEHALSDGEDFELLLTVPPDDAERLLSNPPIDCGLTCVGEILPPGTRQLELADGSHQPLPRSGWEHSF